MNFWNKRSCRVLVELRLNFWVSMPLLLQEPLQEVGLLPKLVVWPQSNSIFQSHDWFNGLRPCPWKMWEFRNWTQTWSACTLSVNTVIWEWKRTLQPLHQCHITLQIMWFCNISESLSLTTDTANLCFITWTTNAEKCSTELLHAEFNKGAICCQDVKELLNSCQLIIPGLHPLHNQAQIIVWNKDRRSSQADWTRFVVVVAMPTSLRLKTAD